MREDRHAFEHRRRAARHKLPFPGRFFPLDLRNAHAAGARRVIQRQQRAERRNENPEALRDLQNRFPFLKRDGAVIDPGVHQFVPLADAVRFSVSGLRCSASFPGIGRGVATAIMR